MNDIQCHHYCGIVWVPFNIRSSMNAFRYFPYYGVIWVPFDIKTSLNAFRYFLCCGLVWVPFNIKTSMNTFRYFPYCGVIRVGRYLSDLLHGLGVCVRTLQEAAVPPKHLTRCTVIIVKQTNK